MSAPLWEINTVKAETTVAALTRDYRDMERTLAACRQCDAYGRLWCCPPHDAARVEQLLARYTNATIFGTKINFMPLPPGEDPRQVATDAFAHARRLMLPALLERERALPGSIALSVRCTLCGATPCSRPDGLPCRHPRQMRPSLESIGFDVEAIARDLLHTPLLWMRDSNTLPSYMLLVTALLSNP